MKRIYLLLTLAIISFASLDSNAQTYFGVKVGGNLAFINGDIGLKGIKPAAHGGFVAEIAISDLFSVQPELLYSIQGSQDKDNAILKNNHHYLTLPIMIKYFINETISIDAGPQVSYLVYAKQSNGWEEQIDNKELLNAFDYSFDIGASYEMDNGMNINVRYVHGFANIFKTSSDVKGYNSVIQLSMGYKFY